MEKMNVDSMHKKATVNLVVLQSGTGLSDECPAKSASSGNAAGF
jgi:hypothetical protein